MSRSSTASLVSQALFHDGVIPRTHGLYYGTTTRVVVEGKGQSIIAYDCYVSALRSTPVLVPPSQENNAIPNHATSALDLDDCLMNEPAEPWPRSIGRAVIHRHVRGILGSQQDDLPTHL